MLPPGRSDRHNERTLDFIRSDEDPFFAWIHYMDVHHPLLVEPRNIRDITGRKMSRVEITRLTRLRHATDRVKERRTDDIMAVYDTAIWETDRRIGMLLDSLDETGRLDDTIVVVTSDHGEAFMEHGGLGHPVTNFYDEQLHVPLVISGLDQGRDGDPVGHVDLAPTLTGMAGIDGSEHFMGSPLPHDRKVVYSGARILDGPKVVVTTRKWRFIWEVESGRRELYDLGSDPGERSDLSVERADAADMFRDLAEQHLRDVEKSSIRMKIDTRPRIDDEG
jgi:arylsulfatase A-like enzyme